MRYDLLFFWIASWNCGVAASKQTFNFVGSASKSNKLQFFLFLSLSTHFFHCLIQIFFGQWIHPCHLYVVIHFLGRIFVWKDEKDAVVGIMSNCYKY
jgi:hypothetical protein